MAVFLWEATIPATTAKGYEIQTTGSNSGTWGTVLNTQALEYIDSNMGGLTTKALTNVNVTLSASESRTALVRLTGTLTGNVIITTACIGFFVVTNATTGSFTVTFTNGTGTSATAVQGYSTLIVSDATNGCRAGNNIPGDVFVASGASHTTGIVPDPGATAGTGRYLREDATFVVPPFQWAPGGRLTLTTGVPVTTSDVTGATSVYYTATLGSTVPVYGSCPSATTSFAPVTITGGELTLTLNNPNHAASTNYDVFMFLDSSTPRIGTGPPWSSATARGTGAGTTQLSMTSGIYVNTVAITARNGATTYSVDASKATYLGTIRTGTTAGTTEDSRSNRFVFNAFNQVERPMYVVDTTNSWTYAIATWRQANAATTNKFSVVIGLLGACVSADVLGMASSSSASFCATGVGIGSTTVNSAQVCGTEVFNVNPVVAHYRGSPGLGFYDIVWLEIAATTGVNFRGDAGLTYVQAGMVGTIMA